MQTDVADPSPREIILTDFFDNRESDSAMLLLQKK
jgi:hypothetical protein